MSGHEDEHKKQSSGRSPIDRQLNTWCTERDHEAGTATLTFDVSEEFSKGGGVLQGGIITAMLDACMGWAVWDPDNPETSFVSLEIQTSYLAPAPPGRLIGYGECTRRGKNISFAKGRLGLEDGTLVATATTTNRHVRYTRRDR